jgi:hypothetical protein
MLTLRDAVPRVHPLAAAEFTTLRLRLLKVAARVIETASRVRIALAARAQRRSCSAALPTPSPQLSRKRRGGAPPRTHPSNPSAKPHQPIYCAAAQLSPTPALCPSNQATAS